MLLVGVVGVEPTKSYLDAGDLQSLEFANTQYPDYVTGGASRNRTYMGAMPKVLQTSPSP